MTGLQRVLMQFSVHKFSPNVIYWTHVLAGWLYIYLSLYEAVQFNPFTTSVVKGLS